LADNARILNVKLRKAAVQFAQLPRALKSGVLLLLQGLLPVATVYLVRK
jgi:hypothetical protein